MNVELNCRVRIFHHLFSLQWEYQKEEIFLEVLLKSVKNSCLGKTSRFALREVQVTSWDNSQKSCFCRTVALNIQLISSARKSTVMLSAEPCLYFLLVFSENEKPAHITQNWETPLSWLRLFDIHFLSVCLWWLLYSLASNQSSNASSYQVTMKFGAGTSQVSVTGQDNPTKSGKHNFYEGSLPAAPGSWESCYWGVIAPQHLKSYRALGFGQSILKEHKEDLEFQLLVKSKRLQMPFWVVGLNYRKAWVFSIMTCLILISTVSEKASTSG